MTNDYPPYLFDVLTPLGFYVHVTEAYWQLITTIKHPVMANRLADVQTALQYPDEVRQSQVDPAVYLFYKSEREKRWVCAVAKTVR